MENINHVQGKKTLVSVIMLAYNHEAYVSKAVESILAQITNFDYELIIGEDCSTDKTRDIILDYQKRYPDKVKIITSEINVGAIANELRCLKACVGKYIAYCEGDDYWTDPYKLQKQVNFLEANADYGLVHGDVNHLNQKTGKMIKAFNKTNKIKIPNGDIFEFLLEPSHSIKTMTTCFRKDLLEKYYLSNKEIMNSDWALIDISIWLMLAYHSKIHYFDEVFATYRLLSESASRTKNPEKLYQFHQKIHVIRSYYAKKYDCSEETRIMIEANKYKSILTDAYALKDFNLANMAVEQLKSLKVKLSLKQSLFYYGLKYPQLKYIMDLIK
jgi:glycosyltransferase involved in cell wall biosynthesis